MDKDEIRAKAAMEILNNSVVEMSLAHIISESKTSDVEMFIFGVAMSIACIFKSFENCPSDAMKMLVGQSLEKEGE